MKKEEKLQVIDELKERISKAEYFYITDSSELSVAEINDLRRLCHSKGIYFKVAKNTLVRKAMEQAGEGYEELYDVLVGPTSLMFSEVSNTPAKVIKQFREKKDKPILKAAYIDTSIFKGDDQVEALAALKSKDELVGDIIMLLQSPAKNVLAALQSGGHTISGLVKALQERAS